MGSLGVHFAITPSQFEALIRAQTVSRTTSAIGHIERQWDAPWLAESDKAWDAIHRCLSDGTLEGGGGSYPLNKCILGGFRLNAAHDRIARLIMPVEVGEVAAALARVESHWLRERFFAITPEHFSLPLDEAGFEYTWHWFEPVRQLFDRAAAAGRAVLFTANLKAQPPRIRSQSFVSV